MAIAKPSSSGSQIEKTVREQLEPLFTEFYVGSSQFKIFHQYSDKFMEKIQKSSFLVDSLVTLVDLVDTRSKKAATDSIEKLKALRILEAVEYLSLVELVGDVYVNQAILLLIAKGIDFHLEPDYMHRYTRHADSLSDIESPNIPLSTKLDFLRLNGLTFFSKWIDKDLRNSIAHMNFEFDDRGNFFVRQKGKRRRIDFLQRRREFKEYLTIINGIFSDQIKKTSATVKTGKKLIETLKTQTEN